jgi:hypothetical protein
VLWNLNTVASCARATLGIATAAAPAAAIAPLFRNERRALIGCGVLVDIFWYSREASHAPFKECGPESKLLQLQLKTKVGALHVAYEVE